MRKNIKKFAGIVLCIGMFTGCAQTPDSSLVKPKGSKAVDAYTEADDVSGSKGEASESKNDDGSESKTTIRNLIDAPQNYKSHVEDDSAKLVVRCERRNSGSGKDICYFCHRGRSYPGASRPYYKRILLRGKTLYHG